MPGVDGRGADRDARPVRVAVVLPEALTRSAVAQALDADPRLTVVRAAGGDARARALVRPGAADVLVVDEALPDGSGVALGLALQATDPRLAVLLLTRGTDVVLALRGRVPRPWSQLPRGLTSAGALAEAVAGAARGQVVHGPAAAAGSWGGPPQGPDDPVAALTPARLAVLRLVAQGLSNRAVARALGLSPRSVENHLAAVYRTVGAAGEDVNPRVTAVLALHRHEGR